MSRLRKISLRQYDKMALDIPLNLPKTSTLAKHDRTRKPNQSAHKADNASEEKFSLR